MGRYQTGELHKVIVVQSGINLIRVCTNCAASWQLVTLGTMDNPKLAWKPIAEVDEYGKEIRFNVDINNCEHIEDTTADTKPAVPAARGLAAVEAASKRGTTKAVCYCKECNGKSPHWQDDPKCYCSSCRGKKQHYAA